MGNKASNAVMLKHDRCHFDGYKQEFCGFCTVLDPSCISNSELYKQIKHQALIVQTLKQLLVLKWHHFVTQLQTQCSFLSGGKYSEEQVPPLANYLSISPGANFF